MPLHDLPAAGMSSARHLVVHVDGTETPTHAFDKDGHHYSHQDFQFRKQLCLVRPDHERGATGVAQKTTERRIASDDALREERIKVRDYNHRRTDNPTVQCLLQPGYEDDGDSYWGVIRENRSIHVPHWSQRQFDMKKDHHTAQIHKNQKGRADVNNVSWNAAHFPPPNEACTAKKIFGESGLRHEHNSHEHFNVTKRRHQKAVDNTEANHRSTQPPLPSHRSHFFASPEPQLVCSYLWPEGPSVTAKHIPKHFVKNVDWDRPEDEFNKEDPYSARVCSERHSVGRKYADSSMRSTCARGFVTEPRAAEFKVFDGTTMKTVADVATSQPPGARIRTAPCATPRPTESGLRGQRSRSSDTYHFYHTPGRPPHPDTYAKNGAHVYRSHAQIMYDKHLCHTELRHSDRWERMEQGSAGHSAGGSSFSSLAGGAGGSHDRRARGDRRSTKLEMERRSRSVEQTKTARVQPTSARAASSDRQGRTRKGNSSRRRGA